MAGFAANLSAPDVGARGALGRTFALLAAIVALLLQANAPIHATLMEFAGEGTYALCAQHADDAGAVQGQDRKVPPTRREACAACAVCAFAGGPALAANTPVLPVPALLAILTPFIPREVSPRAPPRRARRARAPPAYA